MNVDMWEETLVQLHDDVDYWWDRYMELKNMYGPKHNLTLEAQVQYEDAIMELEEHKHISPTGSWLDVNE